MSDWNALKAFFRWLLLALGGLLLLALLALATLGWWLPPLAESQAKGMLERLGFQTVELDVERLGYSGISITGMALKRGGAEATMQQFVLDYSLMALLRQKQAESLVIKGLDATAFLPALKEEFKTTDGEQTDSKRKPFQLPEPISLPVKNFLLDESSLTLEADGWRKRMTLTAYLEDGSPARYLFEAHDEQNALSILGTLNTETLASETTFRAESEEPASWQRLIESVYQLPLPEGFKWLSGNFTLEGAIRTKGLMPENWTLLGSLDRFEAETPEGQASTGQFNFGASGKGASPEKIWAGLFDTVTKGPINANWSAATLETVDQERVYLKLEGWQIEGDFSKQALGDVSASAGPIRVLLDGPWAAIRNVKDLQAFHARLMIPESPLEIYTGKGSVFGVASMQAEIGPAEPERYAKARLELKDASINAGEISISAQGLELSLSGLISQALGAQLIVKNANAIWAKEAGELEGVEGTITVAQLQPLRMPNMQRLTFQRVAQGKVEILGGEINVTFKPATDETPMQLSLTAGGEIAAGRLAARLTLSSTNPLTAQADLLLQNVSLEKLAGYFPKFDGKIQGRVSGELPLKVIGNRIVLQPGYLEMAAGETGKFSYYKQGWLTQDPTLDPIAYAEDKTLTELLQDPKGASILTEIALRDLNLTAFRIDVLKPGEGDRRVIVHLEGDGEFKEVKVPVIQDIRIGGDVKEAINLLLKTNQKITF